MNRAAFQILLTKWWLVGIPTVPLAELYDGCRAPIEQRGGDVRLRTGVREVRVAGGRVAGVLLDLGNEITADHYLFAVPHDALLELLPQNFAQREPAFANLRNLDTSPITGVHFWFDRPVMAEPYLTVLDRTTQWIFNKSLLLGGAGLSLSSSGSSLEPREGAAGQASSSSAQYLQLVISASRSLIPLSRQEIIALCRRELAEILPASRNAELVKSTVIKEAHATFSPAPGCDRWRPAQPTPIPNLFLAGDWTATAWPATMEGAVRSGYLAAEAILAADGRHQTLLQPDLPPEGLARILSSG